MAAKTWIVYPSEDPALDLVNAALAGDPTVKFPASGNNRTAIANGGLQQAIDLAADGDTVLLKCKNLSNVAKRWHLGKAWATPTPLIGCTGVVTTHELNGYNAGFVFYPYQPVYVYNKSIRLLGEVNGADKTTLTQHGDYNAMKAAIYASYDAEKFMLQTMLVCSGVVGKRVSIEKLNFEYDTGLAITNMVFDVLDCTFLRCGPATLNVDNEASFGAGYDRNNTIPPNIVSNKSTFKNSTFTDTGGGPQAAPLTVYGSGVKIDNCQVFSTAFKNTQADDFVLGFGDVDWADIYLAAGGISTDLTAVPFANVMGGVSAVGSTVKDCIVDHTGNDHGVGGALFGIKLSAQDSGYMKDCKATGNTIKNGRFLGFALVNRAWNHSGYANCVIDSTEFSENTIDGCWQGAANTTSPANIVVDTVMFKNTFKDMLDGYGSGGYLGYYDRNGVNPLYTLSDFTDSDILGITAQGDLPGACVFLVFTSGAKINEHGLFPDNVSPLSNWLGEYGTFGTKVVGTGHGAYQDPSNKAFKELPLRLRQHPEEAPGNRKGQKKRDPRP